MKEEFDDLDPDLKLELKCKLEDLKAEYENKKKNAINQTYNQQKAREAVNVVSGTPPDSRVRLTRRCAISGKSRSDITLSPVLCQKSIAKKRKSRKFFPHISQKSLKLLTSDEAVQEFALPNSYHVTRVNANAYVCNTGKCARDDANEATFPGDALTDPLLQQLRSRAKEQNESKSTFLSLALAHSRAYAALIENDVCLKIFVKSGKDKWKNLWSSSAKNEINHVQWMLQDDDTNELLFSVNFDVEVTDLVDLKVEDLSCVLAMHNCKLVVCGKKMCTYSFIRQNSELKKEISFVPADTIVTSLSLIDKQPGALLGSSQSCCYIWNLVTGSLLRQFEVQIPGLMLSAVHAMGAVKINMMSTSSISNVIVNPSNGKQFVTSHKNDKKNVVSLTMVGINRRAVASNSEIISLFEDFNFNSKSNLS